MKKRIVKLFTLIKLSFKFMFDIRIIMTNNVKEKTLVGGDIANKPLSDLLIDIM